MERWPLSACLIASLSFISHSPAAFAQDLPLPAKALQSNTLSEFSAIPPAPLPLSFELAAADGLATSRTEPGARVDAPSSMGMNEDRPDPWPRKFSVLATAGTLGIGPELRYRFANRWSARANATFIGFGLDSNIDDVSYDGNVKLGSGGIAIDYYLGRDSGWHLSAGVRYDSNAYRIKATPRRDVRIGDRVFTPAEIGTLRGRIEGKWQVAPTLTVGHMWRTKHRLQYGFEAGAMFHNRIEVKNLRAEGGLLSVAADFLAELRREQSRIRKDLDVLNVFPIAQIYVGFAF